MTINIVGRGNDMTNPKSTLLWIVYKLIGSIMAFLCGVMILAIATYLRIEDLERSDLTTVVVMLICPALDVLFISLHQVFEKDFFPGYKQSQFAAACWLWIPAAVGAILILVMFTGDAAPGV